MTTADRIGRITKRIAIAAAIVVLAAACFIAPKDASADSVYCVVIAVDNSAWVTRSDAAVKTSLKIGDQLKAGDRIEVFHGNTVDLAFDQECMNTVHVVGETNLEITALFPTNVTLFNRKGQVYVLWDNRRANRNFSVQSPTAVAAVRGTQFQMNHTNGLTQVLAYRGLVRVSGLDKNGRPTMESVSIKGGEKTWVKGTGHAPKAAHPLSAAEISQVRPIQDNADKVRSWLQEWGLMDRLRDRRGQSEMVPRRREDHEDLKSDDGALIL